MIRGYGEPALAGLRRGDDRQRQRICVASDIHEPGWLRSISRLFAEQKAGLVYEHQRLGIDAEYYWDDGRPRIVSARHKCKSSVVDTRTEL